MRAVETIERNARAQVQLIEDILNGAPIINGKLHLEIHAMDIGEVVRSALGAVRPAADAKGIALSVDVDASASKIAGDPKRLQQVVWNLANNAIKFTPKGGTHCDLIKGGSRRCGARSERYWAGNTNRLPLPRF